MQQDSAGRIQERIAAIALFTVRKGEPLLTDPSSRSRGLGTGREVELDVSAVRSVDPDPDRATRSATKRDTRVQLESEQRGEGDLHWIGESRDPRQEIVTAGGLGRHALDQ